MFGSHRLLARADPPKEGMQQKGVVHILAIWTPQEKLTRVSLGIRMSLCWWALALILQTEMTSSR